MKIIAGIDEVGRGCFAGPLVASAVVFNFQNLNALENFDFSHIRDSKKLSALQREKLSKIILDSCICSFGVTTVEEIDLLGLTFANQLAIIRAIKNLSITADLFLIDGNLKFFAGNYFSIIRGDSSVPVIAAASVVAKVYRDKLMSDLYPQFPDYQWHKNKGYGTLEHRNAILKHGITPYHRKVFLKKLFAKGF
jgi:ribonuclease HII